MTENTRDAERERFCAALRRFDEANAGDPNSEVVDGKPVPRELMYAKWLTDWVLRLRPDASEELQLAARSQHICRWQIPRSSFPMTRAGYLRWRQVLKEFHAGKSSAILRELGYQEPVIERVRQLNLKQHAPGDPEGATLEDALCMVFLERQLSALAANTSADKVINALRKSWMKMSPAGREQALRLSYGAKEKALLDQALNPIPSPDPG